MLCKFCFTSWSFYRLLLLLMFILCLKYYVVYWPTTRPGCQNRKCTCVNNRCIQSRNIRIITLTVDRLNEYEIVTLTRRRWTLKYYITQCTGNSSSWGSDELEIRCGRENQHPERLGPQDPGWAAQENGKETRLWPIEWGQYVAVLFGLQLPLTHNPFNKVRGIFF